MNPAEAPGVCSRKPNVLWIFGDQHRAQALGCSGDPNLNTPNIDRLAIDGLAIEQANLAHNTNYQAERRRLQDRLGQWITETADRFALPEDI